MTVVFQSIQRCVSDQGSQSFCWKGTEWAILGNTLGKGNAVLECTKGTLILFSFSEVVCDFFPPSQLRKHQTFPGVNTGRQGEKA